MKSEYPKLLARVPIFTDLEGPQLQEIAKICQQQHFGEGACLFHEYDPGEVLYIIRSGLIRIEHRSPSTGRSKILALLKEGECFGEMALLDEDTRSADAIAVKDTEMLVIRKKDFERIITSFPAITMNIIRMLSNRLRAVNKEIEDLTFKNLQGRIASQLLKLAEKFGVESEGGERMIDLKLTHQEIADLVGTNRESVSKTISAFRREGSVDVREGQIIILSEDLLRTWMK